LNIANFQDIRKFQPQLLNTHPKIATRTQDRCGAKPLQELTEKRKQNEQFKGFYFSSTMGQCDANCCAEVKVFEHLVLWEEGFVRWELPE